MSLCRCDLWRASENAKFTVDNVDNRQAKRSKELDWNLKYQILYWTLRENYHKISIIWRWIFKLDKFAKSPNFNFKAT